MPTNQTPLPCGSWPSPITGELVTRGAPGLDFLDSDGERLYWVEKRPWEQGRAVIMCREADGTVRDLLPAPFSQQSKVHEYGGKAYCVGDGVLYFVNGKDQAIYSLEVDGGEPILLSLQAGLRFADLQFDSRHQRLLAVCEDHNGTAQEPDNYLVAISLDSGEVTQLAAGADFYGYPAISPDGSLLAWVQWHHPNMPWDATELCLAAVQADGQLGNIEKIAGNGESITQPRWSPDGTLHYVSDRDNWWNIYRSDGRQISREQAEFATPYWQFGMSCYDFFDEERLAALATSNGSWQAGIVSSGGFSAFASEFDNHYSACVHDGRLCTVASNARSAPCIIALEQNGLAETLYSPSTLALADADLSSPQSIWFSSQRESEGNAAQVHAFYYPPCNARYQPLAGEKPPVIAICHGGPTGATDSSLNLKIQYWTSRGFAVVDINYRGSTGFGRAYRTSLNHSWGIKDVEDACNAVKYLCGQGYADPERCIIRGGSAGGFTVLAALTFRDTFKAGASLYGIGDLETLARDTHKFEARYLDSMIGRYPEERDLYIARSPINHAEQLNCPVIFLQGLEDKVVPPNQAEAMVEVLRNKGIKTEYVTFADEGHGFRVAANIIRALEAELAFYQDVFGIPQTEHTGSESN